MIMLELWLWLNSAYYVRFSLSLPLTRQPPFLSDRVTLKYCAFPSMGEIHSFTTWKYVSTVGTGPVVTGFYLILGLYMSDRQKYIFEQVCICVCAYAACTSLAHAWIHLCTCLCVFVYVCMYVYVFEYVCIWDGHKEMYLVYFIFYQSYFFLSTYGDITITAFIKRIHVRDTVKEVIYPNEVY